MLKDLKLQTKILLLPGIAALGFVGLIFSNLVLGQKNTAHLVEVQEGYGPSLETSRNLEVLLAEIQRGLQDAVGANDEEMLERTEELRDGFFAEID